MSEKAKKTEVSTVEPAVEKISEQDKHALDLMIMSRKLALSEAEKNEANYRLFLFQLYSRYAMDLQLDAVDETGVIRRNAVKPQ